VEGLRKVFPDRAGGHLVAVDDVSFDVPRGASLAIVGESGSGKTTTARIVAGLETATSGTLAINGRPEHMDRLSHRDRLRRAAVIQMVFQDPKSSLDPMQTVGDAIVEVIRQRHDVSRSKARESAADLLDQVGLDERLLSSRPRTMSGGQRQRIAIARALAAEPEILILDEAVSALDVSVQAQVLLLLQRLRSDRGLTFIFVSHDLAVVRQISDLCLVMHDGSVVERGATNRLLDAPQAAYTKRLISAIPGPGWVPKRRLPSADAGAGVPEGGSNGAGR